MAKRILLNIFICVLTAFGTAVVQAAEKTVIGPRVETAVSTDGTPITFRVYGGGKQDTTLVFIHGWSCDSTYWNQQIDFFAPRYQMVTLDLAGHGQSGVNRTRWTVEAFGRDVTAVVNALIDENPVILVGHSMGAYVALEAAANLPERVKGVIAVDMMENVEETLTKEQVRAELVPFKKDFRKAAADFIGKMFPPSADPKLVARISEDISAAPPAIAVPVLENALLYKPAARLRRLKKMPVVCINSGLFPNNEEAGRLYNPGFRILVLGGLGHFLMMEDPDRFNAALDKVAHKILGKDGTPAPAGK